MTKCMHCGRDLAEVEEIYAVSGNLYCSEDCAIEDLTQEIMFNAQEQATEMFKDLHEIVTPEDIGIERAKLETYEVYVTETLRKIVRVEACSKEDARSKVQDMYYNETLVLGADDYDCTEFWMEGDTV